MVSLTWVAAVALACGYLAHWISPVVAWPLAFAGMAAPFLWLINVALALFWIARWRCWALLPVFLVVLGAGWVSLFFNPVLSRHPKERDQAPRVMTYNVAGFLFGVPHGTTTAAGVAGFIREQNPDILCLQEFECRDTRHCQVIDSLIGLPHAVHSYSLPNSVGGGLGVAIYSRWRIIDHGAIPFENTANSAMWADIVTTHDTLRVLSCHLQTTSVDRGDLTYIAGAEFESGSTEHARTIVGKLRRNFARRAVQADSVALVVEHSPHPVIVCGDFNDTPLSYAYSTMRGSLQDAFVERGRGTTHTYKGLFNLLRIDYVLPARGLQVVSYDSPECPFSDHNPVIAGVRL